MAKTPNLDLPTTAHGHVALQHTVRKGFEIIDEKVGALEKQIPPYTADDEGKVLTVNASGALEWAAK